MPFGPDRRTILAAVADRRPDARLHARRAAPAGREGRRRPPSRPPRPRRLAQAQPRGRPATRAGRRRRCRPAGRQTDRPVDRRQRDHHRAHPELRREPHARARTAGARRLALDAPGGQRPAGDRARSRASRRRSPPAEVVVAAVAPAQAVARRRWRRRRWRRRRPWLPLRRRRWRRRRCPDSDDSRRPDRHAARPDQPPAAAGHRLPRRRWRGPLTRPSSRNGNGPRSLPMRSATAGASYP